MLKFVGVSKFYDEKEALSNISFELDKGDFLFIVGPSGAGKTTILKLIHKEIEPSRGEIFFNNDSLKKYNGRVYLLRRKISMIFQDYKLFKRKTVYENVSFPLEIQGFSPQFIRSRVLDTLKMVGLEEQINKYPNTLSGGEMQRVSIARAIVNNPDILIADEPTGNLDWKTSFNIVDLFVKINENGTTVIMSTHNEEIIKKYNKRILYIKDGKKLYEKYPNIA
ncbi:MAG TPA: ATP-binding cassette domain-containing protein [Caldisericia bacterium]|nr:ATP-binding cassette domain-containing protein [Caldisericia bacterium]HPC56744.1 ATP-binding cassette domain-containing protein [Caldisericia bacterium]HPP43831.1 ATP-binding cassette domain-containing protein [Caldisericia bacterium]HRT36866.1 ATP-binding cassette domain-containing protein [Caldisericia bacterium]